MEETLIIYLGAEDRVRWYRAGAGSAETGSLEDALAAAGEADITLVVPGESVLLTDVELPPIRQQAKRMQAARYALEDQVAAPLDTLHFTLGSRNEDGRYPAAVVERDRIEEWLARLGEARPQVTAMVPDSLCLEEPQPDSCSLHLDADRALVRHGRRLGFACEQALLPAMLRAGGHENHRLRVADDGGENAAQSLEQLTEAGLTVERRQDGRSQARLDRDLLARALPPALNLLQGEFAPVSRLDEWWRPLQATAALFAAWLLLALVAQGVEYYQLQQRYDSLHAQAEKQFRDAFPNVHKINDIQVQAEQEIRRLRGSGGSSGLFPLLQATAAAAGTDEALQMQSFQFRNGELFLSLRGKDIQALERLRSGFAGQHDVQLEVENADAAADGVQIRARVTGEQS